MLRVYRFGRDIVDCNVVNRLRKLWRRQGHYDCHVTGLARQRAAEDLQSVVARSRSPPGGAWIEVDSGGRVTCGVEGAGVPAWPWANALRDLVREEEAEVRLAEGGLGDSLNLLQHPGTQIGIGRAACADRLPWPAELDARQVDIDAHNVQRG